MIAGIFSSQLMQNEFNRGFVIGVIVAAAIVLLLLAIWLILHLTVWSHRSSSVTVTNPEGDIVIARTAIAEAIERELDAFPELRLLRVRLLKDDPGYKLTLNCEFKGAAGLLELAGRLRPRLKEALHKIFGVDNLNTVGIVIERYTAPSNDKPAPRE